MAGSGPAMTTNLESGTGTSLEKIIFAQKSLVATRSETSVVHVARSGGIRPLDVQQIFLPCRRPKIFQKLPLKNAGGFPI
jgi:hypothetical protein